MTPRRRRLVFALSVVALVCGVVAIALAARSDEPADRPRKPPGFSPSASPPSGELLAKLRRHAHRDAGEASARASRHALGNPTEERDARRSELLTFDGARRAAAPIARRFLSALFAYELGERSPLVGDELRATTTAGFGRELVGAPGPWVPPGARRPRRARLVGLEFVPGASEDERLATLEFVAELDRGGERTALALSLRRIGRRWRVESLGR